MAMILDAFLSKFSDLLVQMVQEKVDMQLGIHDQIEKLGMTVHGIQCVLVDAERKRNKSRFIEYWLLELKDVMYDADDIIDLCLIKAKESPAASSSRSSSNAPFGFPWLSRFWNPFFVDSIGSKIKDINSRLEGIAKRKADLGLIESAGASDRVRRVDSIIIRKTDPSVLLADIVGEKIEEDTELLVNWLTEEEKGVKENVCVYAIVGMGGIGKTTLAKRIFNDLRIKEGFQLKIWVCVSKEVKGEEVLKCMIREAGGEHGARKERSELVPLLQSLIQGKKFFFVLDDVWEDSQEVWDNLLRVPTSSGAQGSRLLVTTRNVRVANGMRATKLHQVEKLSNEDGWSLLIKQVAQNGLESEIQDLMEIGMQIVKKCDGLPLAIKSIGGVLCTKDNTRHNWEAILQSTVWSMDGLPEDVHRAFYLSYEDLPPSLKQCFMFCSIFPEDFLFQKADLIYMWHAEGFLKDKRDFWELGLLYYTELLLRNLLEDTNNYLDQSQCKMHDLLWSFARQLGKDENCVLGKGQVLSKSDSLLKVRRLTIEGYEVNTEVIKKEKGLRTLLLRDKPEFALDNLCKAVSKLRFLDLGMSDISSLPDSLFSLVHLRYLNISDTKIRTIPNAIENLRNLTTIDCKNCIELSHISQSISNLGELRCLSFENTKVEAIPKGLNNLQKLIGLYGFKPYKNSLEGFCSLDGLESLSQLIRLDIGGLERVSDRNIGKRAQLKSKNQLTNLYLQYTLVSSEDQLSKTDEKKMTTEEVLNELCPPRSIEIFKIRGYFGRCLPNWLNLGATLPNLKYLVIENCACFEGLAPLGQLPNLDFLAIEGASSVVSVGEEFLWGGTQRKDIIATSYPTKPAFPKLSELRFIKMPNWKEWRWNMGQPAMTKLKKLIIEDCSQLRSLPEGLSHHATSLDYLEVDGADNLKAVGSGLKVQRMELWNYKMETLPEYLDMIMPQKLLKIRCTKGLLLKIASQAESGSEWNRFKHIPKMTIHTWRGPLYATYQKEPFRFTTNITEVMGQKEEA